MWVIIGAITLAVLDASIVNLALPAIARELHTSAARSLWVVNAYQLAILVALLPLSALGDRWGYRRIYRGGMALFTAASLATMLAQDMGSLIAARALQGLGASGIMAVNAALVRLIYPREILGRGMAINALVVAIAVMAGPSLAALILSLASWHWLFAINLPLGLCVWWFAGKALPANAPAPQQPPPLRLGDVLLNSAMFILLFWGAERLGLLRSEPDASAWTAMGLLLGALVLGVWHVQRQRRQAVPLLPVDLLRNPVFALSMGASMTAFAAQTLGFLALPFLLLEVYGRSALQAGWLMTAWPLAIAVVAPGVGRAIGRWPDGLLGGIGMGLFAAGLLALAWLPAQPTDSAIFWRMALCGVGFAFFQSPNNHTIVTSAPVHRSGAASGMLGTARLCGQTLGAVVLATIFAVHPTHDGGAESLALLIASASALCAGLCSVLRVGQKSQKTPRAV